MNTPHQPVLEMALDTIGQQLRQRTSAAASQAPGNTEATVNTDEASHAQLEDYAHILQGCLALHPSAVPLPALLRQCWQSHSQEALAKGLRYTHHGLAQLPEKVQADAQRLRQIVRNLLSNAIRFTGSGRVELHVHWQQSAPSAGQLYLYVVDTGAGMSSRMKDKLFNPFDHVLTELDRHQRGQTGFARHLGLVVTAGIVRAWGGQIEVRSALGTGSTFMVELPMPCVQSSGAC